MLTAWALRVALGRDSLYDRCGRRARGNRTRAGPLGAPLRAQFRFPQLILGIARSGPAHDHFAERARMVGWPALPPALRAEL